MAKSTDNKLDAKLQGIYALRQKAGIQEIPFEEWKSNMLSSTDFAQREHQRFIERVSNPAIQSFDNFYAVFDAYNKAQKKNVGPQDTGLDVSPDTQATTSLDGSGTPPTPETNINVQEFAVAGPKPQIPFDVETERIRENLAVGAPPRQDLGFEEWIPRIEGKRLGINIADPSEPTPQEITQTLKKLTESGQQVSRDQVLAEILKTKQPEPFKNIMDTVYGEGYTEKLKKKGEYDKKVAELKEKYPVLNYEQEIGYISENRKRAQEAGMKAADFYDSRASYIANEFLPPQFSGEYNLVRDIETQQRAYTDFLKNPGMYGQTDKKQQEATLAKIYDELTLRQQALRNYRENAASKIDAQVAEMNNTITQMTDQGVKSEELDRLIQERDMLLSQKSLFIDPTKAVADIVAAEPTLGTIRSHDQFKELYNAWYTERNALKQKLGIQEGVMGNLQRLKNTYVGTENQKDFDRLVEVEDKLRKLAPVALVNRAPFGKDGLENSFAVGFGKSFVESIAPGNSGKPVTGNDLAAAAMDVVQNLRIPVSGEMMKVMEEEAQPAKFNSAQYWGETLGTTSGLMVPFMLTELATSTGGALLGQTGMARLASQGINNIEKLASLTKGGRIVYPALKLTAQAAKEGAKYELTGQVFGGSDVIGEEANFATGFFGGLLGGATEKVMSKIAPAVYGMFGNMTPRFVAATEKIGRVVRAAGQVNARGIAEAMEEYGNEIGNIYRESDSWAEAKKLLEERFGTLDQNMEFFITSYVMGAGMGLPSVAGKMSTTKAKDAYDAMTPEQRKEADKVVEYINESLTEPTKEAKEEGVEIPTAEEVQAQVDAGELDIDELLKEDTDVSTDEQGVAGKVGKRQEPIEAQPIEGAGTEATSPSGILQEQEEITAIDETSEEETALQAEYDTIETEVRDYLSNTKEALSDETIDDAVAYLASTREGGETIEIQDAIDLAKFTSKTGVVLSTNELNAVRALEAGERVFVQNEQDEGLIEIQSVQDIAEIVEGAGYDNFEVIEDESLLEDVDITTWSQVKNKSVKEAKPEPVAKPEPKPKAEAPVKEVKPKKPKGKKPRSIPFAAESITDDIADFFSTQGRISTEQFYQFGDRKLADAGKRLMYLKKGGTKIDQLAQELGDKWGIEEMDAVQAIVDFIADNKSPDSYIKGRLETMKEMEDYYTSMTQEEEALDTFMGEMTPDDTNFLDSLIEEYTDADGELDIEGLSDRLFYAQEEYDPAVSGLPEGFQTLEKIKQYYESTRQDTQQTGKGQGVGEEVRPTAGDADTGAQGTKEKVAIANTEESRDDARKTVKNKLKSLKKKDKPGEVKNITAETAIKNKDNQTEIDKAYESKEDYRQAIESASDIATEAGLKYEDDQLRTLDRPEPTFRARTRIVESFRTEGRADIIGTKIESVREIAELFAFTRNPNIEKGTVVFMKGNEVVGYSVTTLGLIDNTRPDLPQRLIDEYISRGADSVYVIHNHPSGNPTPSDTDIRTTKELKATEGDMKFNGAIVLNGERFSFIDGTGKVSTIPYSSPKLFEPGSTVSTPKDISAMAKQLGTGDNPIIVWLDTQDNIIDFSEIPPLEPKAITKYVRNLYEQRGGARSIMVGDPGYISMMFVGAQLPKTLSDVVDYSTGKIYNPQGIVSNRAASIVERPQILEWKDNPVYNTLGVDPETYQEIKDVVYNNLISGDAMSLKPMIKSFLAEDLEEFIPALTQAYKDAKVDSTLALEIRNAMDTYEVINGYDLNSIQKEYEKQKEQAERERLAEQRRNEAVDALATQSRPVYRGGAGTTDAGGGGRPPLRYANSTASPDYGSDAVKEVVAQGQYKSIDEHQRYAVNMALTRMKLGQRAFLLGDGTGVGKSLEQLVMAIEAAKITGKTSLIITENEQIVNDNFIKKGGALLGMKSIPGVEFSTYSGLRSGKVDLEKEYGAVFLDEAHNLKNAYSKTAMAGKNIKADFEVFATATPMDKPAHAHYFLSKITPYSEQDLMEMLGYTIEYETNKKGEVEAEVLIKDTPHYINNLIDIRNRAIEEGAMIRREYPFYGTIEEVTLPIDEEHKEDEQKIKEYWGNLIDWARHKKGLSKKQREKLMKNYGSNRVNDLSRLNEPKKANFIVSEVQNNLNMGRQVVIVVAQVADDTTIKQSLEGKTVPTITSLLIEKLNKLGIEYGEIYGSDGEVKQTSIDDFQSGKKKVVIMTAKSGGTGIDLDDQTGDAPRTLLYATPDYSGIVFQQVLGRISRRNTESAARAVLVYNNSEADKIRRKTVQKKIASLQAIQDGLASDSEVQIEEEYKRPDTSTDAMPVIEMYPSGNAFIVLNSFPIKDQLKALGGKWMGGKKGWMFQSYMRDAVDAVLDQYAEDSDVKISLDGAIDEAHKELSIALKDSMGKLGVNSFNSDVFQSLAKLASLYTMKGLTKLADFIKKLPKMIPADMIQKAWNTVQGIKTPRKELREIFESLDEVEKQNLVKAVDTMIARSNSIRSLQTNLDGLIARIHAAPTGTRRAILPGLTKYRDMISGAASLTDAKIIAKSNMLGTQAKVSMAAMDNVIGKAPKEKKDYKKLLRNLTRFVDRRYVGLWKEFEAPIRRFYKQPLRNSLSIEKKAELLAGVEGAMQLNANRIKQEVTGKIGDSPKLSRLEREYFEKYLFAQRALSRARAERATGNVSERMAQGMIDAVAYSIDRSISDFEKRAEAFNQIMDDNLVMLLNAGRINQAQYDNIKEKNDFYATYNVISDDRRNNEPVPPGGKIAAENTVLFNIKGIADTIAQTFSIPQLNQLALDYTAGIMDLNTFYDGAVGLLDAKLENGSITSDEYIKAVSELGVAGFQVTSILEAATILNMKVVQMAERNIFMNEMAEVGKMDSFNKFARIESLPQGAKATDFDTKDDVGLPYYEDGVRKVLIVDRIAGAALLSLDRIEVSALMKGLALANTFFRTGVIMLSSTFQVANAFIDFLWQTGMFSRAGIFMGMTTDKPIKNTGTNILMMIPDIMQSMVESFAAQLGYKSVSLGKLYSSSKFQEWMESRSYTGENIINQKILNNESKLGQKLNQVQQLIGKVGSLFEQANKLYAFRRLQRLAKQSGIDLMNDAAEMDRLNYEVRTQSSSPDFANIPKPLKIASILFPFIGARIKGIMANSRRVLDALVAIDRPNTDGTLQSREKFQILVQVGAMTAGFIAMASKHFEDDESEESFNRTSPYVRDNSVMIKTGNTFTAELTTGQDEVYEIEMQDYVLLPVRGLPNVLNAMALYGVRELMSEASPREKAKNVLSKVGEAFISEFAPVNLHGEGWKQRLTVSPMSSLNPVMKSLLEGRENKNFFVDRNYISPFRIQRYNERMAEYSEGLIDKEDVGAEGPRGGQGYAPWMMSTTSTTPAAVEISKYLWEEWDVAWQAWSIDVWLKNSGWKPEKILDPLGAPASVFTLQGKTYPLDYNYFKEED